jgi:PAS domain S-box-containing protein
MIGYTAEELLGLTMYDIVTLNKTTIDMNIENVIKNRNMFFGLRQYLCKDGRIIDVEISSTLISYGDSHVIMVNVRNVTERLKAEKELLMQADRLKDQAELLDIAEDAIL